MSTNPNYGFPYVPYSSQLQLMNAIHNCIEEKKIGCFESPTGTGKSLSIICASLSWLLAYEKKLIEKYSDKSSLPASKNNNAGGEVDWLASYIRQAEANSTNNITPSRDIYKANQLYSTVIGHIHKAKQNISSAPTVLNPHFMFRSKKPIAPITDSAADAADNVAEETDDLTEHCIKAFEELEQKQSKQADEELFAELTTTTSTKRKAVETDAKESDNKPYLSNQQQQQQQQQLWEELQLPQIYYCTRTHSQLSQFMEELKKPSFASDIRCVVLASRKQLCINTQVTGTTKKQQLSISELTLNERCLDLQKQKKTPADENTVAKRFKSSKPSKVEKKLASHCAYHMNGAEERLAYKLLSTLSDIEELVIQGNLTHTCPYYASRSALPYAHIVCMPYPILLDPTIRNNYHLSLHNRIVIIDEAHNLIDTIQSLHAIELSALMIHTIRQIMEVYVLYYEAQLSGQSLYYLKQIIRIMKQLDMLFSNKQSVAAAGTEIFTINSFLFLTQLDSLNLFTIHSFVIQTELMRKLIGWIESFVMKYHHYHYGASEVPSSEKQVTKILTLWNTTHTNTNTTTSNTVEIPKLEALPSLKQSLRQVFQWIQALTCHENDGRVCLTRSLPATTTSSTASSTASTAYPIGIKFVLLNPAHSFHTILSQARSVILLGGTMQPFQYFDTVLFHSPPPVPALTTSTTSTHTPLPVQYVACPHIVPSKHVLGMIFTHYHPPFPSTNNNTNTMKVLDGTHTNRYALPYTNELYYLILQLVQHVPDGMILFFTSYAYMYAVLSRWKTTFTTTTDDKTLALSWYGRLEQYKHILVEPNKTTRSSTTITTAADGQGDNVEEEDVFGGGGGLEDVWNTYKQLIAHSQGTNGRNKGAILCSVIGGKLSEGINFSDELARAVVIIGMPFPDARDPILQERIRYYSATTTTATTNAKQTTTMYSLPETMCMKAVNQAIGRCIRHAKDYAAVFFLDHRYAQPRVMDQLPGWIKARTMVTPTWSPTSTEQQIRSFFAWNEQNRLNNM